MSKTIGDGDSTQHTQPQLSRQSHTGTDPIESTRLDEQSLRAGHWMPLESPVLESMRGLDVVDARVVWAAGAKGTILRSIDAGESWQLCQIEGAEDWDFRDVHGFDGENACLMVAGTPARIYRTADAGQTWDVVYEDTREGAFHDALEFWDETHGIVFGDPIDGRLAIATTEDGGRTWQPLESERQPIVSAGEHGYAASGTCLMVYGDSTVWIGLGGIGADNLGTSNVLRSGDRGRTWERSDSNLPGSPSAGVFSLCFVDAERAIAVGGDYLEEDVVEDNVAITTDGGMTWRRLVAATPSGYRSAVRAFTHNGRRICVATGPNGSDLSFDGGETWETIDGDGYHAIDFSEDGTLGIAVGSEGRIARWVHQPK